MCFLKDGRAICLPTGIPPSPLPSHLAGSLTATSAGMVQMAYALQQRLFIPLVGLSFGAMFLCAVSLACVTVEQAWLSNPFEAVSARRRMRKAIGLTLFLAWLSALLSFGAAVWITSATSSLALASEMATSGIEVVVGQRARLLHWMVAACSLTIAAGLTGSLRKDWKYGLRPWREAPTSWTLAEKDSMACTERAKV